jgi:hypothetical protein
MQIMAILTMMAGEDEEMHYSTGEDSYHSCDDLYIYSEDEESESDFSGLISNFWGEEEEEYDDTSSKESEKHQDQAKSTEKSNTVPCVFRSKKEMAVLPCCGGSNNQFCKSCMIKYLQSQQTPDTYADPYCELLVGACPPCCQLISICTHTNASHPFVISKATFQQSIGYAFRTGGSEMRVILMTAAYVNSNFMLFELLGEDMETII